MQSIHAIAKISKGEVVGFEVVSGAGVGVEAEAWISGGGWERWCWWWEGGDGVEFRGSRVWRMVDLRFVGMGSGAWAPWKGWGLGCWEEVRNRYEGWMLGLLVLVMWDLE